MRQNYRFNISYDGSRFYGWEHQPNTDMTIQGKIETVLTRMVHPEITGDKLPEDIKIVEVLGAGRTDAGVHAKGMVANAFLDTTLTEDEIRDYVNRYLPDDIRIDKVSKAGDRFHSRYNALGKTYCYSCYIGDTKPLFDRKYVYVLDEKPDIDLMKKGAEILVGEHDFASFCSNPKMKKSTVRLVDMIDIKEDGDYLRLTYHGSGFLQHMVRILTGTLLEVGFGKRSPESLKDLIEAKKRALAGPTAPACGLCLMQVDYH